MVQYSFDSIRARRRSSINFAFLVSLTSFFWGCNTASALTAKPSPMDATTCFAKPNDTLTKFRGYDHDLDFSGLQDICKDVYGGTDYLPQRAAAFAQNPLCRFRVCLGKDPTTEHYQLNSLGNIRRLSESYWFLEAIRTRESSKGQGLATKMCNNLINEARESGADVILSATTEANVAMQRIFEKIGFSRLGAFHISDFQRLREIQQEDENWEKEGNLKAKKPSMSEVLGLHSTLKEDVQEGVDGPALLDFQMTDCLEMIQEAINSLGGLRSLKGTDKPPECYLPTLYGAIPALAIPALPGAEVYIATGASQNERGAVVVFFHDPYITSLKSDMVCTIVANDEKAFEQAFAFASSRHERFVFVLDPAIPRETGIYLELPLVESQCIILEKDAL